MHVGMGIQRHVALLEKVGNVVYVYASPNGCCEAGEYYIPVGVF